MGVKLGRPKSDPLTLKRPNGLTVSQWDRVKQEACTRSMPAAMLLRQIVDWYIISIDSSRSNNATSQHSDSKKGVK